MADEPLNATSDSEASSQEAIDSTSLDYLFNEGVEQAEDEEIVWTEEMMPKFESPPTELPEVGASQAKATSTGSDASGSVASRADALGAHDAGGPKKMTQDATTGQSFTELTQDDIDRMIAAAKSGETVPIDMPAPQTTERRSSSAPSRPAASVRQPEKEVVKPVEFSQFAPVAKGEALGNLDLLMDVKMPMVVELGRSRMFIKDILSLGPGSIVELDRAAGEPVDLLVNGKLIARGEVVVIDENFGLRITEIVTNPAPTAESK